MGQCLLSSLAVKEGGGKVNDVSYGTKLYRNNTHILPKTKLYKIFSKNKFDPSLVCVLLYVYRM